MVVTDEALEAQRASLQAQIERTMLLIEERNRERDAIQLAINIACARATEHARTADCKVQLILSDVVESLRPHVSEPS